MGRSIINSDTFNKIFAGKEDLLAEMAVALAGIDYKLVENNITCDAKNPNDLDYIIRMPYDSRLEIFNTKSGIKITIDLKNK